MKKWCLAGLGLAACLALGGAQAVELVIPWPQGGETDLLMRPIAPYMAKHLKQTVQIVNKPGQFGMAGVHDTALAPADGSTWVTVHDYAFSVEVSGQTAPQPLKDLVPFCGIVEVPSVLATNSRALGNRTPKEFLASKGEWRVSWTVGPTSTNYMLPTLVGQTQGRALNFKGYRSKEAAVSALMDGEVDLAEVHIQETATGANRLVMLGVAAEARDPQRPDLPTLKELGLDVQFRVVRALAVPRETPASKVAQLERACRAAAAEPELDRELQALGARARFTSAADMARLLDSRRTLFLKAAGPAR